MLLLFLIGITADICFANIPSESVADWVESSHEFAVDFPLPSSNIDAKVFSCLRESGYTIVFLPVYNAHERPFWIRNAASNIRQAIEAGLGVEVYMVPNYHLFKEGAVQMTDVFYGFNSTNLGIRRIWVKVKSREDMDWYWENNRAFLNQIISTARKFNIDVGFYTNRRHWNEMTKEWELKGHPLWYWNVRDVGPGGESPANFRDFRPFGGWTEPTVKQYGKKENVCGVTVNWKVNWCRLVWKVMKQQNANCAGRH